MKLYSMILAALVMAGLSACGSKDSSQSSVSALTSVYIKIGAQPTYLKATVEQASTLVDGQQKCELMAGKIILLADWPQDAGDHTLVTLRYPLPNCALNQGYVYIPHIARQNEGTFNLPGTGASGAAAAVAGGVSGATGGFGGASSGRFTPNCSSRSVTVRVSANGNGVRTYGDGALGYGTCATIERINELARRMVAKTGFPIFVGDVSAYGGGNLGRHKTHVYGDDMDIATMGNTDRTECYNYNTPCYNRAASRALIQEIIAMGGVTGICFNDPAILSEFPGVVRYCAGHENHYHVEWHN
jgi:hypothetical protein